MTISIGLNKVNIDLMKNIGLNLNNFKNIKDEYNVEPIISIWPTVQTDAMNFNEYLENGYLVKVNRGVRLTMQIQGNTILLI